MLTINKGDRFNRLIANREGINHKWEFLCDCGNKIMVYKYDVIKGHTSSCGCFHRDQQKSKEYADKMSVIKTKHGMYGTPTYRSWLGMGQRCNNEKNAKYPRYGGRGIKIVKKWQRFENFLSDMGVAPEGTSIGRVNNDGNYCKKNCRWETPGQQMHNTSLTKFITHNGETLCQSDWAKKLGLAPHTLVARVRRGWTPEAVVSTKRWQRGERLPTKA